MIHSVVVQKHTTRSTPGPHVVYVVEAKSANGCESIYHRYSDFVNLKTRLKDPYPLPARYIFANVLVPYAFLDDDLLAERKAGLQAYLSALLSDCLYRDQPLLLEFLGSGGSEKTAYTDDEPGEGGGGDDDDDGDEKRRPLIASYYPSWAAHELPPSKIPFYKFDVLFYSFVTPTGTSTLDWEDGDQGTLKELVKAANAIEANTKIVLSVGGWSGSHWFSQAMSTPKKRETLLDNILDVVTKYGLDGVDVDWEYPNAEGKGNPHAPADTANLLEFFKILRHALGPKKIVSAAVTQLPWFDANGKPLKDVSEFAKYMSYVNIMNYDAFGASSKPGPNAPLGDLCKTSTQPDATAHAAFANWTAAKMPARKLLLGLPTYGYVSKSTQEKLSGSMVPAVDDPVFPRGAHPRGPPRRLDPSLVGDLSHLWGEQIAFRQLIESAALMKTTGGTYVAGEGYTVAWDDCSDTPFLYSKARKTVVTYDDTYSIATKVKFAKTSGMGGCFTWSIDQDDDYALQNVIIRAIGRVEPRQEALGHLDKHSVAG